MKASVRIDPNISTSPVSEQRSRKVCYLGAVLPQMVCAHLQEETPVHCVRQVRSPTDCDADWRSFRAYVALIDPQADNRNQR